MPHQPDPAADLQATILQSLTDLARTAERIPGLTGDSAASVATVLDLLSAECAEAAAMARALPGRHEDRPGYSYAAAAALAAAAEREADFPAWLAGVLGGIPWAGPFRAWMLRLLAR